MTRLRELQEGMAAAITAPTPLATGEGSTFAEREIRASARIGSGSVHLDIYREQFGLRHRASLAEDFPALRAHLGPEAWDALLTDYLAAHPPAHYTLLYAGHKLSEFLGRDESGFVSYFEADLASFEYALVAMSELADAAPLSMDAVAAVPEEAWPSVRLVFQPAFSLHGFAYPVHRARMQHDQQGQVTLPEDAQTFLAVARGPGATATYAELPKEAFYLLRELAAGKALGTATAEAAKALGVELSVLEASLPGWFQNWIAWGWVCDLVVVASAQ